MGRTAGPMLERVWKWSKVNAMMVVACTWVRKLSDRVASVEWREGVRIKKESGFNWQPLFHHTGDDMKKFQLELRWSDGVPLGVFQVKISEYHDISHGMMELLHSIAPLLTDTVADIEKMAVADSVPAMQDFGTAYDNARMLLPRKLQSQMKQQLAELNSYQIVSELKGCPANGRAECGVGAGRPLRTTLARAVDSKATSLAQVQRSFRRHLQVDAWGVVYARALAQVVQAVEPRQGSAESGADRRHGGPRRTRRQKGE